MNTNLISPKMKKKRKRRGRGYGSGVGGHTVGRGQKGQKSRTGNKSPRKLFEGASNPLIKRIPKLKGFTRRAIKSKYKFVAIKLSDLDKLASKTEISLENIANLNKSFYKSKNVKYKILANGELTKPIMVKGIKCSESAKKIIEDKGGKVIE